MTETELIVKYIYSLSKSFFDKLFEHPYAHIKGQALSYQAYGSIGKRHTGDIDILIPKANITYLTNCLKEEGFVKIAKARKDELFMLFNSHQTSPWYKSTKLIGNIEIDINHDIFWGEYEGERIDILEFLNDTVLINICNTYVKTLPPTKALIQLILHTYKDMNSIFLLAKRKKYSQTAFADIYNLIINNQNTITIESLNNLGEKYNIKPYIYYVLYYTYYFYDSNIIKKHLDNFKTPEGQALINSYGLCTSERKEWRYDIKTRLLANNLNELIMPDLTAKDLEKIKINEMIF